MEPGVQRKIHDVRRASVSSGLASPSSPLPTKPVKVKINVSSIAQVRTRDARSPLQPKANTVNRARSPSPNPRIIQPSSASPDMSALRSPVPGSSFTANIVPKAKTSSLAITKRASASKMQSSTPPSVHHALRSVSSSHSLPITSSSQTKHSTSGSSLRPTFVRAHARPASISDASSLSATSPSSASSLSVGMYETSSDTGRRHQRIGALASESLLMTSTDPSSAPQQIRVKSKVSRITVNSPGSPPLSLSPPSLPSVITRRPVRTSSISSTTSSARTAPLLPAQIPSSPPNGFARATTPRPLSAYHYQSFPTPSAPPSAPPVDESLYRSPPNSAASSRLSFPISSSTGSVPEGLPSEPGTPTHPNTLSLSSSDVLNQPLSQAREAEAEAKTNRKIADLEITNRSLLAINATLEATKLRQANEIRELRRRLRETRLTLPPKTYAALEATDETNTSNPSSDNDDDTDGSSEDDPAYDRVKIIIEHMLSHGNLALKAATPLSRGAAEGMVMKVLSAAEVQAYKGDVTWASRSGMTTAVVTEDPYRVSSQEGPPAQESDDTDAATEPSEDEDEPGAQVQLSSSNEVPSSHILSPVSRPPLVTVTPTPEEVG